MQETQVQSLSREDPLEQGMATHSSILAWRIPWTEEPGRLYSMGSQRVRHIWPTNTHTHTHTHTLQSEVQRGIIIIVLFWNVLYFCSLLLYDFHPISKTSVKEENYFGWLGCLFLFSTLTSRYFRFTYNKECEINNTLQNPWASPIEFTKYSHPPTYIHTHTQENNFKFHSTYTLWIQSPIPFPSERP